MTVWLVYYLDCERGRALWEVMPSPAVFRKEHDAEMAFLELVEEHDMTWEPTANGKIAQDAEGLVMAVVEEIPIC